MYSAAGEQENYDVFISYRHETGFFLAQVIYNKLFYSGYSIFMDKNLPLGTYEEHIKRAISKSRNFVVILFPSDLDTVNDENDWIFKEATWATQTPGLNIVPVMCDGFVWPETELPDCMKKIMGKQGVTIHKDYSLDSDLDRLCDKFFKNVNPVHPLINTEDFFRKNLFPGNETTVTRVDLAFHAGAAWFMPGDKKDIMSVMIQRRIPMRILVNTPEAAESIARHMRDDEAFYATFEQACRKWKEKSEKNSDFLEVRMCDVPLLRVHHGIYYIDNATGAKCGRLHIKYYAYNNLNLNKAYEHEISSYSKYFGIYENEFQYLWERSKPI